MLVGLPCTSTQSGYRFESLVARYIQSRGYKIICRNWHCKWGELDIVAKKGAHLFIFEVKGTSTGDYTLLVPKVQGKKLCRLIRSINTFLVYEDYISYSQNYSLIFAFVYFKKFRAKLRLFTVFDY